jgi:peptidoglycan pentaglycine glycine transferase (the first glycine)
MLAHAKLATGVNSVTERSRIARSIAGTLIGVSLIACSDAATWDAFVSAASDGTPLQSWAWGAVKATTGWAVRRYLWGPGSEPRGAISVLRRALPGGLALHYAPRGPVLDGHRGDWPAFFNALQSTLKDDGGTILKLDPPWTSDDDRAVLAETGGRRNPRAIQHQATWLVDISGGDAALMRMKESTRRNIRAGERQGITVEASDSEAAMDAFYSLLQASAERRQFVIRPLSYYRALLRAFAERGQVAVYLARHQGGLVAGAVMLFYGATLVYLYGGTRLEGDLKPGYYLHWRAIQDAQLRGCTRYDMWGVPLDPTPEHPGYGYYVFKTRFNGELVRFIGLYDLPIRQPLAAALRLGERFVRASQPEFV